MNGSLKKEHVYIYAHNYMNKYGQYIPGTVSTVQDT